MYEENQTMVTEFLLLGFGSLHNFKILFFFLILVIYMVTLSGNVMIITLVSASPNLHSPMYFFLSNLSLSDIIITTSIVPNMLRVIWKEQGTIYFTCCIFQFYIYGSSIGAECLLLTVMSFDRYVAINNPLRYHSIMDFQLCLILGVLSWVLCWMISSTTVLLICQLQFCDSNIIDHFFCDFAPLLKISCSDTSFLLIDAYIASILVVVFPFVFITVTYVCIFLTILRMPSTTGRQKAFSTCSSHLMVVCTYYGTMIVLYMVPFTGQSLEVNKFISLLNTVATPLLNPIIYSLRNQEIRTALRKYVQL
ncbi:olfactory receptor 6X1-like [Ascaphus truei]|uniref:olfactory receptor 6X1-like n=1 Tax=Ascaphus truei TaxID=8439 RepID=UPI003F5AB2F9